MSDNFLHPKNAYSPILVTLFGISICVNFELISNACAPISVTVSGIIILSNVIFESRLFHPPIALFINLL